MSLSTGKYSRYFLLLALGLFGSNGVFPFSLDAAEVITVQGSKVNIRTGPGLHFPVQKEVGRGERLIAWRQDGEWYEVEIGIGQRGWIREDLVRTNPLRQPQRSSMIQAQKQEDFSGPRMVLDHYIRFFQEYISPADGARSTLYPTTSAYSREALQKHGALIGYILTIDRLMHDRDEVQRAPRIRKFGSVWPYDPVERNDFWWATE